MVNSGPAATWADPVWEWGVWERRLARHVLDAAQRRRKDLGLTAKDMAERLTRAGWPVSVNTVNGILGKKGRESISVSQLVALAEAVESSPSQLLFPYDQDTMEIRPGIEQSPAMALLWFFKGSAIPKTEPEEEEESADSLMKRVVQAALKEHGVQNAVDYLVESAMGIRRLQIQLGLTPSEYSLDDDDGTAPDASK